MSTYSTNLALELIGTGEQAGTWGNTTNTNLGTLIEQAISGYVTQAVATGTDTTLTIPNGATGVARNMYIELTGTGGTNTNLIVPSNKKLYFIYNNSTGAVTVKVSGQTGVSVAATEKKILVSNGTDIVEATSYLTAINSSLTLTTLTATSANITTLTSTNATAASLTVSTGNLTFSSTGQRITGDFSNATVANRLAFQTSTTNGNTSVRAITNGTATTSNFAAHNGSDANNTAFLSLQAQATEATLNSGITGTGTYLPMTFYTGGSERMRLSTAGNLGLGVSPSAWSLPGIQSQYGLFSGQNETSIVYNAYYDSAWKYFQTGASVRYYQASGTHSWDTAVSGTAGNAITYTQRMIIDSSGNVGIGTASPGSLLDVAGVIRSTSASAPFINLIHGSTDMGGIYSPDTSTVNLLARASKSLVFMAGGATERMRIDSSGNVGIGTASPSILGKLAVVGAGSTGAFLSGGATDIGSISTGRTTIDLTLGTVGNTNNFYTGTASGDSVLAFGSGKLWIGSGNYVSGGSAFAVIDSSGNVGIGGTADATTKLQLTGTLPTSGTVSRGILITGTVPSGSTAFGDIFVSLPSTAAAAFTCSNLRHFVAAQSTIGAGSTVTNQYGFSAESTLTGATNNYGFYSNIASGSNRWNFYAAGTARNYFAGRVTVGTTQDDAALHVLNADDNVACRAASSKSTGLTADIFQVTALNHASGTGFYFERFYSSGPTVQFAVRGDGTIYAQNTTVQSLSDARVKENVRTATEGLAVIDALRPVRFDFKEGFGNNRKNQLGFVAQEVEAVFPDAVDVMGDKDENGDSYKSVGPAALIPVLVKAIQELSAKVAALEAK